MSILGCPSIKRKLVFISMVPSCIALISASVAFLSYEVIVSRQSPVGVVAFNCAAVMVVVAIISVLIAFLLSRRLVRVISEPISHLASIASAVAAKKDYSLRAVKQSDDELGRLIDGFNEMLDQIQQGNAALQAARDHLEKRVEERTSELAKSISLLNATLESTADGVLAVSLSGKINCVNSEYFKMWGLDAAVFPQWPKDKRLAYVAEKINSPELFLKSVQEEISQPEVEAFDILELKDGRTFERYKKPQWMGGKIEGIVINCRDITNRKRAEIMWHAEMERVHKQLLETSREAGMAEVATSVLHNVGNVLNSVNVSCSVISEKVRKSRVGSVAKTAALLREHEGDLVTYFTSDPTAQKLPEFLDKLSRRLAEEQETILEELQQLTRNIAHIKEIISLQQSYAKFGGVSETLLVDRLVEDALRMNLEALARHHIEVIRDYSETPPVPMEKHKVLQILVNLVRNAKHALTASEQANRQIVVRIARADDRVTVTVQDNGMGIAPENMIRIFALGFTTKKGGHGFGLHSGVIAAQEMGGTLTAHSDGVGLGATFTLAIPIPGPENHQQQ